VTLNVEPVLTRLLEASSTSTVTAGAIAVLRTVCVGCCTKPSLAAVPAVTLNDALVADVSEVPGADAVSLYAVPALLIEISENVATPDEAFFGSVPLIVPPLGLAAS